MPISRSFFREDPYDGEQGNIRRRRRRRVTISSNINEQIEYESEFSIPDNEEEDLSFGYNRALRGLSLESNVVDNNQHLNNENSPYLNRNDTFSSSSHSHSNILSRLRTSINQQYPENSSAENSTLLNRLNIASPAFVRNGEPVQQRQQQLVPNIISSINRISTDRLLSDFTRQGRNTGANDGSANCIHYQQDCWNNQFSDHELHQNSHSSSHDRTTNSYLNNELNTFLQDRKIQGEKYDNLTKVSPNYLRKRKFNELNEKNDNINNNFKFTRVQPCSFLKPGTSFINLNNKDSLSSSPNSIEFLNVDYEKHSVSGYIKFDINLNLRNWLNLNLEISPLEFMKNSALAFDGEIVDFETNDLRFQCSDLRIANEHFLTNEEGSKFFSSNLFKNSIIRKQLFIWQFLKPFHTIRISKLLPVLTCEDCVLSLQKKFILMKLSIKRQFLEHLNEDDEDEIICTVLVCIDRETGELEMTTNGEKHRNILDQFNFNTNDTETVTSMVLSSKRYVSSSIQLA